MKKLEKIKALTFLLLFSLSECSSQRMKKFRPDSVNISVLSPVGAKLNTFHRRTNKNSKLASALSLSDVHLGTIKEEAREGRIIMPQTEILYDMSTDSSFFFRLGYLETRTSGKTSIHTPIPGFYGMKIRNELDAKVGVLGAGIYSRPKIDLGRLRLFFDAGIESHFAHLENRNEIDFRVFQYKMQEKIDQFGLTGFGGIGFDHPAPTSLSRLLPKSSRIFVKAEYHETLYSSTISDDADGWRVYGGLHIFLDR